MSDVKQMKWRAVNGSVFTEEAVTFVTDLKTKVKTPLTIAFNIGDNVAEYLVTLHNNNLEGKWS